MSVPSIQVQDNAWRIGYANAQTQPLMPRAMGMLLEKIIASQGGRFSLDEVKRNLASQGISKHHGLAVTLTQFKRAPFGQDANYDNACTAGASTGIVSKTYALSRMIAKKVTLNYEEMKCLQPSVQSQSEYKLRQFYSQIHELLAASIEQLVGTSQYIGNLPSLNAGGATRPYANLPLLNADGFTLNPVGDLTLTLDMNNAGAGSDYFVLGNTRAMAYALAKKIAVPNQSGYNPAALEGLDASKILFSPVLPLATRVKELGLQNPILVIENGALLFVSAPLYEAEITNGSQRFWSEQHPNLPGVWINIIETKGTVCELTGTPTVTWSGTVIFELINSMTCDWQGNIYATNKSLNGVYLYEATCAADTLCDMPNRTAELPTFMKTYDPACDNPQTACAADATCRLDLFGPGYQTIAGVLYAVFNAQFVADAGSTALPFGWAINGNTQSEISNILVIPVALLANGDVVSVKGGTSTCEVVKSIIISNLQGCGTLTAKIGAAAISSGDTVALGSVAQNATLSRDVDLSALGFNISVTALTASVGATSATPSSSLPFAAVVGGTALTVTVAFNTTALGAKTGKLVIASTDCDGDFEINFTYTVA